MSYMTLPQIVRLIAAAPDLLESLIFILSSQACTLTHGAMEVARAAVAKAKGEQP